MRFSWQTALALPVALGALSMPAAAEVEVGAMVGFRVFNDDNELGATEHPDASSLANAPLFGLRLSALLTDHLGLEAEAAILPSSSRTQGFDVTALVYRLQAIAQLPLASATRLRPFAVLGVGASQVTSTEDENIIYLDTDAELYAGVGTKLALGRRWGARLDARLILPPSSEDAIATLDGEVALSLFYRFGGDDQPAAAVVPVMDADGDGVADDRCPQEAEDTDGFEDTDGCPEDGPQTDGDADGVADPTDRCPTEPEDRDGAADDDGCPDLDDDGDGVADASDNCPREAEDADGHEDGDGCPDLDDDGDGVADAADQCQAAGDARRLETVNGFEDDDGCADTAPQPFSGTLDRVAFATGTATLTRGSRRALDAVAKQLLANPTVRVEIQGHTDDRPQSGSEFADNQALSLARAEAVRAYLVGKGVAADRLVAIGLGDSQPAVPGTTAGARAKNRRVEFKVLGAP